MKKDNLSVSGNEIIKETNYWQRKIDTYFARHRLKLLVELSQPAYSMFDNLTIAKAENKGDRYTLFFESGWEIIVSLHGGLFEISVNIQNRHKKGFFAWYGRQSKYSKYMQGCNYHDAFVLGEFINPVTLELLKMIKDVSKSSIILNANNP